MRRIRFALLTLALWFVPRAAAQTTQGVIGGIVTDLYTGDPLLGARVYCTQRSSDVTRSVATGPAGTYAIPALSPGIYRVRVQAVGYQNQELHEMELAVAGRVDLHFH